MSIDPVFAGKLHINYQPVIEVTTKAAESSRSKREEGIRDGKLRPQKSELPQESFEMRSIELRFSVHEETDRIRVTVFDKETGEMIREVPHQDVLDLMAKIDEMIGILFDEKA